MRGEPDHRGGIRSTELISVSNIISFSFLVIVLVIFLFLSLFLFLSISIWSRTTNDYEERERSDRIPYCTS